MRVEVCIPATRTHTVNRLISSLEKGSRLPDRITVISNEVTKLTPELLPARILRFRSEDYPIGGGDVALRRNIGIWHSDADAIVFIDDDCIASTDMLLWFDRKLAEKDVVWGHHRYIDVDAYPLDQLVDMPPSAGKSRERIVPAEHSYQSGYAGCLGAKRSTLLEAGGFDLLFLGRHANEDQNLALRLCGQKIWVDEPPFAWHPTTPDKGSRTVTNQCSEHLAEPVLWNGVVFMKCAKCPHWSFADKREHLFRDTIVVPYDDSLVSVTEEEF